MRGGPFQLHRGAGIPARTSAKREQFERAAHACGQDGRAPIWIGFGCSLMWHAHLACELTGGTPVPPAGCEPVGGSVNSFGFTNSNLNTATVTVRLDRTAGILM